MSHVPIIYPTPTTPTYHEYTYCFFLDHLTDALADELLARVSAGEAVFCEHLEALAAA
jgi:hypothetical protein